MAAKDLGPDVLEPKPIVGRMHGGLLTCLVMGIFVALVTAVGIIKFLLAHKTEAGTFQNQTNKEGDMNKKIVNHCFITFCFFAGCWYLSCALQPDVYASNIGCAAPSPEWDKAQEIFQKLNKADAINPGIKQTLFARFDELKRERNSYVSGTAPICRELFELESKINDHNRDSADYENRVASHNQELSQFNAQCSSIQTLEQQQSCQAWADTIKDAVYAGRP